MTTFYSTKDRTGGALLDEAVLQGLAADGGLFMPRHIAPLRGDFFKRLPEMTLQEIAQEVTAHLLGGSLSMPALQAIVEQSITFDAPLVKVTENFSSLELFHGPTLSFKDFGARFMARLMGYLVRGSDKELHILAATSGDTGSAVAHGFLDVPGIRVWILYPKGKVSIIQEKQLTTIGRNITALEVDGSFDDCQSLVKEAFNDSLLRGQLALSSANSINIARLIPQSFYYFYAYAQLNRPLEPVVFSVPSGNFGNLTAGLLAKHMGLPVERFIAATNANECVPRYLQTGSFYTEPTKHTISNAMDVGNPSNWARIFDLYRGDLAAMRRILYGASFDDEATKAALQDLYLSHSYLADPHGAVAYLGLQSYQNSTERPFHGIFLETAHPAKFLDSVQTLLPAAHIPIPEHLAAILDKEKIATPLTNSYGEFRNLLLAHKHN